MTPAVSHPTAALPDDPVRAALDDPHVRAGLSDHARAILGKWLSDRPAMTRADAAAEAVQDTQMRALENRHNYKCSAGSATAWLHGILNKVLLQTARSLRRLPVQPPDESDHWEALVANWASNETEEDFVQCDAAQVLTRLPVKYQAVLELRYRENLDHVEIAARLGISPVNARVRLCRALTAARILAHTTQGRNGNETE